MLCFLCFCVSYVFFLYFLFSFLFCVLCTYYMGHASRNKRIVSCRIVSIVANKFHIGSLNWTVWKLRRQYRYLRCAAAGRYAAHTAAVWWIDWTASSSTQFRTTRLLCRRRRVTGCSASSRCSWRRRSRWPRCYWTATPVPAARAPTKSFRWRTGPASRVVRAERTAWWYRRAPRTWRRPPLACCAILTFSCWRRSSSTPEPASDFFSTTSPWSVALISGNPPSGVPKLTEQLCDNEGSRYATVGLLRLGLGTLT